MRRTRAFSLTELLVVLVIVVALFAFIMPVIVSAKSRSWRAENIAMLRQIGMAGAMYAEDHGAFPGSCKPLVAQKLIQPGLCISKLDPSKDGLANQAIDCYFPWQRYSAPMKSAYKRSFIGWSDLAITDAEITISWELADSDGWMLDVTGIPLPRPGDVLSGKMPYTRLMLDGSVALRKYTLIDTFVDGQPAQTRPAGLLFVDPTPDYVAWRRESG